MKRIYLLRHGKSESKEGDKPDFERTLIERGRGDAEKLGTTMREKKLVPERVISSSARRAMETARLCVEAGGFDGEIHAEERLYSASSREILQIIRAVGDDAGSVMVVGHNPAIEDFNEDLMGTYDKIKTSNLVWYDIEADTWSEVSFDSIVVKSGMLLP